MAKNTSPDNYTKEIKKKAIGFGADLVGVADVEPLKQLKLNPAGLLDGFVTALSIGVRLPQSVFEQITDHPTPLYSNVYQTANRMLDEIGFRTAMVLERDGWKSVPIPASQVLDRKHWYGAISHKAVGRMAGLGWQGKSLLLVTARYGPRIRLATILTSAPLTIDGPVKNRCGKCTRCRDACPVGAIKGIGTRGHYKSRNAALHFTRCAEKLVNEFSKLPDVGAPICGICIKVCPYGRQTS